MAPQDDLKTYAVSTTNFYDLLSLSESYSGDIKSLDRAWRKTALKYHPDKVGPNDEAAKEKFHLANIGYEILRDPTLRELYDRTRAARLQKERQRALLAEGKRKAREDLEARERGAKRSADVAFGHSRPVPGSEEDDETRLEREIRRIAEDGRRRREEMVENLRRERREREAAVSAASEASAAESAVATPSADNSQPTEHVAATELDRTVKVRFVRNDATQHVDAHRIERLFKEHFGDVEFAFDRKDKKTKSSRLSNGDSLLSDTPGPNTANGASKKTTLGTAVLVFRSLLGAHAAVEKWRHLHGLAVRGDEATDPLFADIEDVAWASGKEPEAVRAWGMARSSPGNDFKAVKKENVPGTEGNGNAAVFSTPKAKPNFDKLKGTKPSFSFSPKAAGVEGAIAAATATGGGSPFVGKGNGSPSLEELTMMRLRHAAKRKQAAEELQAEEEKTERGEADV